MSIISDVHPEHTEDTTQRMIFDKTKFKPPKNSLLSIKSEKDIQDLSVKELKVIYFIVSLHCNCNEIFIKVLLNISSEIVISVIDFYFLIRHDVL